MNISVVTLDVGDSFSTIKKFNDACKAYSIQNTFEYKLEKSDKSRYTIVCKADGCSWRLHASSVKSSDIYRVKTFNSEDTCFGLNHRQHAQAPNPLLAQHLPKNLKNNPFIVLSTLSKMCNANRCQKSPIPNLSELKNAQTKSTMVLTNLHTLHSQNIVKILNSTIPTALQSSRRHQGTNFFVFSFVMVPLQLDSIIVAHSLALMGPT